MAGACQSEKERDRERERERMERKRTTANYILLRSGVQIRRHRTRRSKKGRQTKATTFTRSIFLCLIWPRHFSFLSHAFHPHSFTLPFVFVVRICTFFFCYFISCGESFAYHLAQVPTDSLLFDLLFVLILRSAASRLSSQRQHFENEASGNRVLQNNRAGFAFR
jgi:hypothetical protein